jgi:predicted kinase
LAAGLASRLELPLIAKDTIKEALMSVWPVPDVDASRTAGRAAMAAMLSTAVTCGTGAVLDANFHRGAAAPELARLPGHVVEVFCTCPRAVCLARYRARQATRSPGHFDEQRTDEEIWNDEVTQPIAGNWPLVRVDTGQPVDAEEVTRLVGAALVTASAGTSGGLNVQDES